MKSGYAYDTIGLECKSFRDKTKIFISVGQRTSIIRSLRIFDK